MAIHTQRPAPQATLSGIGLVLIASSVLLTISIASEAALFVHPGASPNLPQFAASLLASLRSGG